MKIVYIYLLSIFTLNATIVNSPYKGGVALIDLSSTKDAKPKALFGEKEVLVTKIDNRWKAIVGISLNEKSSDLKLDVIDNNSKVTSKKVKLISKEYQKQYIKLKTNKHVTLSKENLNRHWGEKKISREVLDSFTNLKLEDDFKMLKPIKGMKIGDDFGKRRYFNNQPRKPHSGVDIAAKEGTDIFAPLDGRVSIAKEFFFSGNVIYLDHGDGLITLYAHLSKFNVKSGDLVKRGDKIGEVGKTGRVTGAHLHFGIALNGNMVNPKIFF